MTLNQLIGLSDTSDSIKCRRSIWGQDMYVVLDVGDRIRFSFGFPGPDRITDEDKGCSDWEELSGPERYPDYETRRPRGARDNWQREIETSSGQMRTTI